MLIKLWERLRGYDNWAQTDATILSSEMEDHVFDYRGQIKHEYESVDTLAWTDRQGNRQTAPCRVPDDSPLYQFHRWRESHDSLQPRKTGRVLLSRATEGTPPPFPFAARHRGFLSRGYPDRRFPIRTCLQIEKQTASWIEQNSFVAFRASDRQTGNYHLRQLSLQNK